jgi:hypothetical protein
MALALIVSYVHPIIIIIIIIIIFSGTAAQHGLWPPRPWGFLITHNDTPQSIEPLWTSDQLVAETSTWQHTAHKHPCPRWDSNPRSQQADSAATGTGICILLLCLNYWLRRFYSKLQRAPESVLVTKLYTDPTSLLSIRFRRRFLEA